MKRLVINPEGWPCTLAECPPGHFLFGEYLCFKTEYAQEVKGDYFPQSYCETGEFFWGGTKTHEERSRLIVQPVTAEWEEYEE